MACATKIIHDYFEVAWDVVWNTVQGDMPALRQQIAAIFKDLT